MNLHIAVIGSNGMLGRDVCKELNQRNISFTAFTKDILDITSIEDVGTHITSSYTHVINCAAYTNVDEAESNHELCDSLNITGVKNLTDRCKKLGVTLLSMSTDYVFDGKKESYTEDSTRDPINYYGLSKAKGEEYIESQLSKYFIIRTAWLFGINGKNFVDTMITLGTDKDEITVVSDQIGSPTYTQDLAKSVISLLYSNKYGIYHLTNSGSCSWMEFAIEIMKQQHLDCKVLSCTSSEFERDAKRPAYSILRNTKTALLPSWKNALKRYLEERT